MKSITKADFFYVTEDNYDIHSSVAIPFYNEMHTELLHLALLSKKDPVILDLGCGTGTTSSMLLNKYPGAELIAIDLFEEMLNHAREKLQQHGDRVSFLQADFRMLRWKTGIDLCVSALAMHHILAEEKKELFRKIFDSLNPGGKFIMLDWSAFMDPGLEEMAYNKATEYVIKSGADDTIIADWIQHWKYINIPHTNEDMCTWLFEAGFSTAECVIRNYGMSLLFARK